MSRMDSHSSVEGLGTPLAVEATVVEAGVETRILGRLGPGESGPGQLGPGQLGPGELGPGQLGPGQLGPGQLGLGELLEPNCQD